MRRQREQPRGDQRSGGDRRRQRRNQGEHDDDGGGQPHAAIGEAEGEEIGGAEGAGLAQIGRDEHGKQQEAERPAERDRDAGAIVGKHGGGEAEDRARRKEGGGRGDAVGRGRQAAAGGVEFGRLHGAFADPGNGEGDHHADAERRAEHRVRQAVIAEQGEHDERAGKGEREQARQAAEGGDRSSRGHRPAV